MLPEHVITKELLCQTMQCDQSIIFSIVHNPSKSVQNIIVMGKISLKICCYVCSVIKRRRFVWVIGRLPIQIFSISFKLITCLKWTYLFCS